MDGDLELEPSRRTAGGDMTVRPVVSSDGDDVLVRVRAQPRGSRNEIAGMRGGSLLVRVTAAPVDGRANQAICRLLARAAGLPPSRVAVERGAAARDKVVRLRGACAAAVATRLGTQ